MTKLHQAVEQIPTPVKASFDIAAAVAYISVLAGQLTTIVGLVAAVASAAWCVIRLFETRTVQRWLGRRREFRTRASDRSE